MSKKSKEATARYEVKKGRNGKNYVPYSNEAVRSDLLHLSTSGNSKTGPVAAFNLPVENSCSHYCECYYKAICYACSGFYMFASNQLSYAENLKYFLNHSSNAFVNEIVYQVMLSRLNLFRWFTCGTS